MKFKNSLLTESLLTSNAMKKLIKNTAFILGCLLGSTVFAKTYNYTLVQGEDTYAESTNVGMTLDLSGEFQDPSSRVNSIQIVDLLTGQVLFAFEEPLLGLLFTISRSPDNAFVIAANSQISFKPQVDQEWTSMYFDAPLVPNENYSLWLDDSMILTEEGVTNDVEFYVSYNKWKESALLGIFKKQ